MVEEQNATLIEKFVKSVQQICPEHSDQVEGVALQLGHATREIYVKEIQSYLPENLAEKIAEQAKLKVDLEKLLAMLKP